MTDTSISVSLFKRTAITCAAAAVGLTLCVPAGSATASAGDSAPGRADGVPVQLLALNDLHGNLDPVDGPAGRVERGGGGGLQAGGLPQLATLMKEARSAGPNSLTVGAGDMIGGSPLLSALFHDEPTIHALEQLGLDASSVGNHEFDEGPDELRRIADGGCHPEDGCAPGGDYDGTDFPYLAANVTREGSSSPLLRPYTVKTLPGGQRIGFIGLVTKEAPGSINASQIRDVEFHDELAVIKRYSSELKQRGVEAQVLLIHEGEAANGVAGKGDCDADGPGSRLRGRIKEIAEGTPSAVDVVVTGHSHDSFECTVTDPAGEPRMVTQADSFGRSFTDLRFGLDGTGDVIRKSVRARNHVVPVDTPKQPAMTKLVETWRKRSEAAADRTVGYISADLPGRGSTERETPLGSLLTDAQVEATRGYKAEVAFLNPGGMRADLVHKGDGKVTYADAYRTQPFDNPLWTMTLTGEQLIDVLKEQVSGENAGAPRFLQLSSALSYSVDMSRAGADRLLAGTVRVDGRQVQPTDTYRVTVNDFLANGGNGFSTFTKGTDREGGDVTDLEAMIGYLKDNSAADAPLAPPTSGRITFLGE
ncbi:bifunctional metallophosphatase/5'-nucleotidase [Streptomyces sp. MZ04]|uniref:bifunctional metallophosphatase/5'-nucleotidase n=1 Tax=Streptomyces sp. MZ04 TaxID=2559236 RepID=UPI00107EAC29|nr:bifunctional metallophosphatase/5'-nucleotidase [Streptomyces sp. MZ04]TGB15839.1 bifunctional metallophosphatase/5'-nucleotidase [Streptomyces sp. MZ04]